VPPLPFAKPPQCPEIALPSDDFLKEYLQEDKEWDRFIQEETARQDAEAKAIAAEKVARKEKKKNAAKDSVRRAISALDCPANRGFSTKIDEGPNIIARCGGGSGSHTLPLADLVGVVVGLRFSAELFTEYVHRDKHKYVGRDVNELVAGFMEVTPLPDAAAIEAEIETYGKEAMEKAQRDHESRMKSKMKQMQAKREEARHSQAAKNAWGARLLASTEWQEFLSSAESWAKQCESLFDDWDEYDHARKLLEAELGEAKGFVERAELPVVEPADWSCHQVLQHATTEEHCRLAQRWRNLFAAAVSGACLANSQTVA